MNRVQKKYRVQKKPRRKNNTAIIFAAIGVLCVSAMLIAGLGIWLFWSLGQSFGAANSLPEGMTYTQWRTSFKTKLTKRGPAPQEYQRESARDIEQVRYPSGSLQLQAWIAKPSTTSERSPALVFLHGGFAFGMGDLESCQPAIDRGFVVMAPSLRGENGNPGNFELFMGEVDDARAAVKWLAKQDYVDPDRIYVFGHSVGGGVSAVLSLLDDVPIQHCGSSGGLYPPDVFWGWADILPFNNTQEERMARLLLGNIQHMQRPHYAYLGSSDTFGDSKIAAEQEVPDQSKLTIEMVPGDHFSSFDRSLRAYLKRAK